MRSNRSTIGYTSEDIRNYLEEVVAYIVFFSEWWEGERILGRRHHPYGMAASCKATSGCFCRLVGVDGVSAASA